MKKLGFFVFGVACVAMSGCGAVNSLIPEVDNLVGLNGSTVDATVGSGRALISGNINRTVTLPDTALDQLSKLKRIRLRQSLAPSITVKVPTGKTSPASFVLSNIALQVRLSESGSARVAQASGTYAGPVTFTRDGVSNSYTTTATVEVRDIVYSNDAFTNARDIITTAPSPNTAEGRLSFDADDTQLPSGTLLSFTFANGKAKVEL